MSYEEMSDLQINLLVANAIGVDADENSGVVYGAVKHGVDNVVSVIGVVDYCNNPSDAWPIIERNGIGMYKTPDGWACGTSISYGNFENETTDANPLRAAMIVFLMMQE